LLLTQVLTKNWKKLQQLNYCTKQWIRVGRNFSRVIEYCNQAPGQPYLDKAYIACSSAKFSLGDMQGGIEDVEK